MIIDAESIAKVLGKASQIGEGWVCCCPAHNDANPSLSINNASDGKILVYCHAGCPQQNVINKLKQLNLWPDNASSDATYNYIDGTGALLYQVVRSGNKKFSQRRPDGNGGWTWHIKGIEKIPYRLPQLLTAIKDGETIFIAEGEKDCDRLVSLGLTATTNSGGAGKWRHELSNHFKSAKAVIILPDNDEIGLKHSNEIAASLNILGVLVKIVSLPGLPAKGDVSDWLNAGGSAEQLLQLCSDASMWSTKDTSIMQDHTAQLICSLDDIGNAERFKNMFGSDVLWVSTRGKWLVWTGKNWVFDELEKVLDYAKKVARAICEEVNYVKE